ncbi:MAG: helix-turn-helix domain-containing protein [Metallibacterium scheffleri]
MNAALTPVIRKFEALAEACCDSRLARGDLAVLSVILRHANSQTALAWPGVNRIAVAASLHRSNVMLAIKRLEAFGLVTVERGRGQSNRYRPTFTTSSADATSSASTTSSADATSSASTTSSADATQLVAPALLELVAPARPEPLKSEPRSEPRNKKGVPVELPAWLPSDIWQLWIADRKERGKPMTSRAQELGIKALSKLRDEGHDPKAVIDNAITRGWQGLYPPPAARSKAPGQLARDLTDSSKYIEPGVEVAQS